MVRSVVTSADIKVVIYLIMANSLLRMPAEKIQTFHAI